MNDDWRMRRNRALGRAKGILRDHIRADLSLMLTARLIGVHYVDRYINDKNLRAWPSKSTVAEAIGCSSKTVQRSLRELEGRGHFQQAGFNSRTNVYQFPLIEHRMAGFSQTKGGQRCPGRATQMSRDPGQECPPTLLNDSNKNSAARVSEFSFPRCPVPVVSPEAAAWEKALMERGLGTLGDYDLAEPGSHLLILPAPRPPWPHEHQEWHRVELFLREKRRRKVAF